MRTTSNKRRKLTVNFDDLVVDWIRKDSDGGAGYLSAAWEEGPGTFLLALRYVVEAHGGITKLAKKTGLHRVSLHTLLSKAGNPRLENLHLILNALGLQVALTAKSVPKRRPRAG